MRVTNRSLFFLLLYIGALFTLAYLFKAYFTFLILGAMLVALLNPVNRWLQGVVGNRIVSSLLMTVLVIVIILVPMGMLLYSFSGQVETAQSVVRSMNISALSDSINERFGTSIALEGVVIDGLNRLRSIATQQAPTIIGGVVSIVVNLFIMFFVIYYGFKEGDKLRESLFSLLPLSQEYLDTLRDRGRDVLYGTLYGQLSVSIIQGLLTGISFWLFGLQAAILWGFMTAVFAFLPMIGTPIVWGPAAVYLWATGEPGAAIGFLIFNAAFTMNIDNVLKPKLISERAQMHPLLVLLSIFGGLKVFGFIGFFIGPVIVAVCILIIEFYIEDYAQGDLSGDDAEALQV